MSLALLNGILGSCFFVCDLRGDIYDICAVVILIIPV